MMLEKWLFLYLDTFKKHRVKKSTYDFYLQRINNFKSIFDIDIKELTVFDIQNVINSCIASGASYSTLKSDVIILSQALDKAVKMGYIPLNPCGGIELPGRDKKNIDILSDFEVHQLIHVKEPTFYHNVFMFLLFSGCRCGEVLALTQSDIDVYNSVIHINKNYYRGQLSTPKTASGFRDIPLTAPLYSLLPKDIKSPTGVIFVNSIGTYIDYHCLLRSWYREQDKAGFIKSYGLHALRHTYASKLIKNGADVKTVSELLGHKDIATTLNFYTHSDMSRKKDVVKLLDFAHGL